MSFFGSFFISIALFFIWSWDDSRDMMEPVNYLGNQTSLHVTDVTNDLTVATAATTAILSLLSRTPRLSLADVVYDAKTPEQVCGCCRSCESHVLL